METRHRLMLMEARADAQTRLNATDRAIYALVAMRERYKADEASESLMKAWVAEDNRLRLEIHNYTEFLSL